VLDPETAEAIWRLLDGCDLNYVQIARRVGVSAQTVSKIARGQHHPRNRGMLKRCSCGALVVPPCRACDLRRRLPIGIRRRPDRDYELAIELKDPDEYDRYARLRAIKMLAGEPDADSLDADEDDSPPTLDQLLAIEREDRCF